MWVLGLVVLLASFSVTGTVVTNAVQSWPGPPAFLRHPNQCLRGIKASPLCARSYCECFASGRYCDGCNCLQCYNNRENEATRQSAVEAILERNPNAFRPKITVWGHGRRMPALAGSPWAAHPSG